MSLPGDTFSTSEMETNVLIEAEDDKAYVSKHEGVE